MTSPALVDIYGNRFEDYQEALGGDYEKYRENDTHLNKIHVYGSLRGAMVNAYRLVAVEKT